MSGGNTAVIDEISPGAPAVLWREPSTGRLCFPSKPSRHAYSDDLRGYRKESSSHTDELRSCHKESSSHTISAATMGRPSDEFSVELEKMFSISQTITPCESDEYNNSYAKTSANSYAKTSATEEDDSYGSNSLEMSWETEPKPRETWGDAFRRQRRSLAACGGNVTDTSKAVVEALGGGLKSAGSQAIRSGNSARTKLAENMLGMKENLKRPVREKFQELERARSEKHRQLEEERRTRRELMMREEMRVAREEAGPIADLWREK